MISTQSAGLLAEPFRHWSRFAADAARTVAGATRALNCSSREKTKSATHRTVQVLLFGVDIAARVIIATFLRAPETLFQTMDRPPGQ
jgi:hypothetical protein